MSTKQANRQTSRRIMLFSVEQSRLARSGLGTAGAIATRPRRLPLRPPASGVGTCKLVYCHKLLQPTVSGLERFSNLCALSYVVQSGFFLRKKPLGRRGFGASQLENRCSPPAPAMPASAQEIATRS